MHDNLENFTPSGVVNIAPQVVDLPESISTYASKKEYEEEYPDLAAALTHINLGDNHKVRHIAWSLYFVDKKFIDRKGIKALATVFKNCAVADFSNCFRVVEENLSSEDYTVLRDLLSSSYMVIPIKGVRLNKGRYSWENKTYIKFSGINLSNFDGNALFRSHGSILASVKGVILFGKVLSTPPRIISGVPQDFVHDYTLLEATMQSEIINILETA